MLHKSPRLSNDSQNEIAFLSLPFQRLRLRSFEKDRITYILFTWSGDMHSGESNWNYKIKFTRQSYLRLVRNVQINLQLISINEVLPF